MRIIKQGILPERDFICKICGCEFVANLTEYKSAKLYWQPSCTLFEIDCPCCGNQILDQEETKND